MSTDSVLTRIKDFVGQELLEGDDEDLEPTTPLLELGLLDSLSFAKLNKYLEDTFSILIPPADINATNFKDLQAITALVERLRG